jgi:iron complex outermembrane receptor protein
MSRNLKRGALRRRNVAASALLASTMLTTAQLAFAQQQTADSTNALPEIVVTAQKRSENLQKVPISIQAIGETKIEQLNIENFSDYVKFIPSVSYQSIQPGQTNIYMRGIASGGDGNHSGPLPSVGLYLDEIPVTTIQGQLDVHIYDVNRIEALSGPQGTLFGASSEAGALRIISNEPDKNNFSASYDLELSGTKHGGLGDVGEGYVNIPLSNKAAIRIVGWQQHEDGYIDNVFGTRTFPSAAATPGNLAPGFTGTINNAGLAKNGYNDSDLYGGRVALKVDLSDDWTVMPTILGQDLSSNGIPAFDTTKGDLKLTHFAPETNHDRFVLLGLTIKGKIGDFDLTYAGGGLIRDIDTQSDYSDYSFFYDTLFGSGAFLTNAAGQLVNPSQSIQGHDHFTKQSHELRISSPSSDPFRVTTGLFLQRQEHNIEQIYNVSGLDPALSISNRPGSIWLTEQLRTDRDYAWFGQTDWDFSPDWTLTTGVRVFKSDNSLYGFYGFGAGYSSHTGEAVCFIQQSFNGSPCVNINKEVKEINATYKATLTYKIDPDKLIYATGSSGFRPGGVNRAAALPPYTSDYIYNYELGWKTSWLNNTLRWNGAVYLANWDNFQFSFLGANGLTVIANAGAAEVKGLETELTWKVNNHLTFNGGLDLTDAELSEPYCGTLTPAGDPVTNCANPLAKDGSQLPVTPYVKGNLTARYDFNVTEETSAFVQSSLLFNGPSKSDLRAKESAIIGRQPSYTTVDLSAGVAFDDKTLKLFVKNLFDERGQAYRTSECATTVCGTEPYVYPIHPLTFGLRFGQAF